MPKLIIDTTAPGLNADWVVLGAPTGWEAVLRGSSDVERISASVLNANSSFFCGSGFAPYYGRVIAVSLHYRVRQTVAGAGASVDLIITRGGFDQVVTTEVLTTNTWVDGSIRLREDWATSARFDAGGVGNLGAGAIVSVAPGTGTVEVSQLWLEVEYIETDYIYDPYDGALPDAIVHDLVWGLSGTQPAALAADYLNLVDASGIDWVSYQRTELLYGDTHNFEWEIGLNFNNFSPASSTFFYLLNYADGNRLVQVALIRVGAFIKLAFVGTPYEVVIPLIAGVYHHYKITVDRSEDSSDFGWIRVYQDYAETPLLEARYIEFPTSLANNLEWGTGDSLSSTTSNLCDVLIDFVSWQHRKRHNDSFDRWSDMGEGSNEVIPNSSDTYIFKPIIVPPMLHAGQSDYCCQLVVSDPTKVCSMRSLWQTLDATPLVITVDYRMDQILKDAFLQIQRLSDRQYWNDGGVTWQVAPSQITLPNQMNRTRHLAVASLATPFPDALIVTIGRITAVLPAYSFYLYKFHVQRV